MSVCLRAVCRAEMWSREKIIRLEFKPVLEGGRGGWVLLTESGR